MQDIVELELKELRNCLNVESEREKYENVQEKEREKFETSTNRFFIVGSPIA